MGSPCIDAVLAEGQAIAADGVLDFDLATVAVSGVVTVDGAPLPETGGDRGVVVSERDDGGSLAITIDPIGAADYAVRLPVGRYEVSYRAGSVCSSTTRIPCNGGLVASGVAFDADGIFDVALRAVNVRGRVTLAGASLPDAAIERGALRFSFLDGTEARTRSLDPTGEATYELFVMPGRYVVTWAPAGPCPDSSSDRACVRHPRRAPSGRCRGSRGRYRRRTRR